jgi:hypothetical protein
MINSTTIALQQSFMKLGKLHNLAGP